MLIPCSRLEATFADLGIRLQQGSLASMVWDEHGGTFVLKAGDLQVSELPAHAGESDCRLEISLTPGAELISILKRFATFHQLPLAPPSAPDLKEAILLAAFHLPAKNLFIFAEEPALTAVHRGDLVELVVSGIFNARRVPCQETDMVIHLTKPAMARLVAFVLHLARIGM